MWGPFDPPPLDVRGLILLRAQTQPCTERTESILYDFSTNGLMGYLQQICKKRFFTSVFTSSFLRSRSITWGDVEIHKKDTKIQRFHPTCLNTNSQFGHTVRAACDLCNNN